MERKFQVGDRVRVIDAYVPERAANGTVGEVVAIDGEFIKFKTPEGQFLVWKAVRFELVEEAPHVFKVGDKVRVVKKAKGGGLIWPEQMDQYVNNGEVYTIEEGPHENGSFLLSCHWNFLPDSLELVVDDAKPAKKAAKAKPKKPRKPKNLPNKSLRAELIKVIKARYPAGAYTGMCSYAAKMEDNTIITQIGQPCHASIGYAFNRDKKVKELAYSVHHELVRFNIKATKPSIRAYKKYLHYMLNESPWAPCFLTKSVPVALRYDVLMDVSRPKNEIAGACIALREGTEYRDKRYIFEKVLDKGFSGHTAYLMSFLFGMEGNNTYQLLNLNRGHCVLTGSFKTEELIKFFKEGYFKTKGKEPYSEDHYSYSIFSSIAAVSRANTFEDFINPLLKSVEKGEGWNRKVFYPEENFLQVAEAIEQLFKEQA